MALTANARYVTKPDTVISVRAETGTDLYDGALCMCSADAGGAAAPYDGNVGAILLGWHFGNAADDGTSSPTYTAKIARGGFTIKGLTVAGLGGTAADIGKKVYATDDGTYSVTDNTSLQVLVGHVSDYVSSALADVTMVSDIFGTVGS